MHDVRMVCIQEVQYAINGCCVYGSVRPFLLSITDRVSAEAVGWLAPGALLYFLNGLLPLFTVSFDNDLHRGVRCTFASHIAIP